MPAETESSRAGTLCPLFLFALCFFTHFPFQYWPEDTTTQKEIPSRSSSQSSSPKFTVVLESKDKFNNYVVRKMHYRTSVSFPPFLYK